MSIHEQNLESTKHAHGDSQGDHWHLSREAYQEMSNSRDNGGGSSKKGSEPDFLDMSQNDPMSRNQTDVAQSARDAVSPPQKSDSQDVWSPYESMDLGNESADFYRRAPEGTPTLSEEDMKTMKKFFDSADTDKNGKLDIKELTNVVKEADTNKDGGVDLKEMEAYINKLGEEKPPECKPPEDGGGDHGGGDHGGGDHGGGDHGGGDHGGGDHGGGDHGGNPLEQLFKSMDANGDGKLSPDELLAFLDSNGDGTVSPEELAQFITNVKKAQEASQEEKPAEEQPASETPPEQEQPASEQPGPEQPEQPQPTPEQPQPAPEQPQPAPEQPQPTPEQPQPTPEQPQPTPEQPQPTPEQPQPTPEQPQPTPEQRTQLDMFPSSDADWSKKISEAPAGSTVVAKATPETEWDNDKKFDKLDRSVQEHIADANEAGLKPLGYVGTNDGTRPLGSVFKEIDSWYKNADVKGIYVGTSGVPDGSGPDAEHEKYYKTISDYIQMRHGGIAVVNGQQNRGS